MLCVGSFLPFTTAALSQPQRPRFSRYFLTSFTFHLYIEFRKDDAELGS